MQEQIGELAGAIWNLLREKGEVKLTSLPKLLNEKSAHVNIAVGWLAREDKIAFTLKKKVQCISLKDG